MKIKDMTRVFSREREDGLYYAECMSAPVRIGGLPFLRENGNYHRLPDRLYGEYSVPLRTIYKHTSGATVTLRTDSPRLGLRVILEEPYKATNMSYNGIAGLDVYRRDGSGFSPVGVVSAPTSLDCSDEKEIFTLPPGMNELWIYLPLYSGVRSVEIGLEGDAVIEPPEPLPVSKPVVFYGSSVTQGGCAGRAGSTYPAMLARELGFETVNLGFSGCGCGEQLIASLIAGMPMSAFVLDYDHNAPGPDHLRATHYPFYKTIRDACPDLPVILMSKIDPDTDPLWRERRDIIRDTYRRATAEGDTHIAFIDGSTVFEDGLRGVCTVDGHHPSELGFYKMYLALSPVLRKMWGLPGNDG